MRKLVFGAAAVCLIVGALGAYIARQTNRQVPLLPNLEEEQEAPAVTPFPLGDLARQTRPTEDNENAIEAVEPIVVEGAALEPSTVTKGGGETLPLEGIEEFGVEINLQGPYWGRRTAPGVKIAGGPAEQAPRPDEEPGHERKMPYSEDRHDATWLGARLWTALCRVLTGEEPPAVHPLETQEPPVSGEDQAEPAKPPVLRPLFAPAMDYHHHQQCCPYTGRCPIPYHPVPPPVVPESR